MDINENLEWGTTKFNLLGVNVSVNLDEMVELNYNPVIAIIKKLLSIWSHIYLTPVGKITIIKTLALSKFSHLILSIPSTGRGKVKSLESIFLKFTWDNKLTRLKINTEKTLSKGWPQYDRSQ